MKLKIKGIGAFKEVPATMSGIQDLYRDFPRLKQIVSESHDFEDALSGVLEYLNSHHLEAWIE
jgi:hypothetical protein